MRSNVLGLDTHQNFHRINKILLQTPIILVKEKIEGESQIGTFQHRLSVPVTRKPMKKRIQSLPVCGIGSLWRQLAEGRLFYRDKLKPHAIFAMMDDPRQRHD